MAITANIAPNITTIQQKSFYITIVFDLEEGSNIDANGFTLADNLLISGSNDISLSDLTLLYVQSNFVVIAVDLPNLVKGSFIIDVTGNISINTVDNQIVGISKTIQYNTSIPSDETFDTTPTSDNPTKVEISLSTAYIENSGIVIAQFDFDYGIPYFDESHVTVGTGCQKSETEVIDDEFTRWIILVTMPSSGQGTCNISVDEDAIGFTHAAASAQVQHQESIMLTILDADTSLADRTVLSSEPMIGELFEYAMEVKGNNVQTVDVKGVLRPFYHHWDSTNGKLYIRSIGEVEQNYDNFMFRIEASDDNGSTAALGTLSSPMAVAPIITAPAQDFQLYFGLEFEALIRISNDPTTIEVDGTWLGLTTQDHDEGIVIFGSIPFKGSAAGQFIPGVNSGEFTITASNDGGDAIPKKAKWSIFDATKPIFGTITSTYQIVINTDFTTTLDVTGSPEPTIEVESGSLPTGLSLSLSRTGTTTTISFDGQPTTAGTFTFKFKATNVGGVTISSEYTIIVYNEFAAPRISRDFPSGTFNILLKNEHFPVPMDRYFDRGSPPGIYSLSGPNTQYYQITNENMLSLTAAAASRTRETPITIACTNAHGSVSQTYGIYLF